MWWHHVCSQPVLQEEVVWKERYENSSLRAEECVSKNNCIFFIISPSKHWKIIISSDFQGAYPQDINTIFKYSYKYLQEWSRRRNYISNFFSHRFLFWFFFCNGLRVVKIKNCAFSESELSSAEQSSEAAVVYPQCFHIYLLHEIMDSCFLICLVRWIRRSGFLK